MRGYMTYILPAIVMAFILLGLFYKGNREQAPNNRGLLFLKDEVLTKNK